MASEPIGGAEGWTIERNETTAQARYAADGMEGDIVVTVGLSNGLVIEEQLDPATVDDGWTFSCIPDAVLAALGYVRQPAGKGEG